MAGKSSTFTNDKPPQLDSTLLNIYQNESKNLIESSGQTLSDADSNQHAKAVAAYAGQGGIYCTDSGSANAYVVTQIANFKAPPALKTGLTLRFRPGNANTGASTINAFGLGNKNIKRPDGSSDPLANDITTTKDTIVVYDGTNFLLDFGTELANTTTQGISYLNKPVTITNNATDADHDMDFGAGNFDFDDGSGQATLSALTKQFDATFALGTNAGGMVSGESLPASGFVYVYQISNASGTITDIIGTTTADGSTISGDSVVTFNSLTKKKYLCALPTDASNNILAGQYFVDRSGYKFRYKDYILVDTSGYTSRTAISMRVPPNSIVNFLASAGSSNATTTFTLYTNLSDTDSTPSLNNCSHATNVNIAGFGEFFEITNSSGQIGKKSNNGLTSSNNTRTKGWEEKY